MAGFGGFAKKLFGTAGDRQVKAFGKRVAAINALEDEFKALSDAELAAKTQAFRARLDEGTDLDALLPEAFAAVREAATRTLGLRHFDVQLIGGMALNKGGIAEMATGEGKTLVATLPVYLNALAGKGVHVVTVNDYLAERDAMWMGPVYDALGLKVGIIKHGMPDLERKIAYGADVTYGTNNEYGFDYLRDNMKFREEEMVQRPFHFAIVDEVDSILIDEARTPLIISGPAEDSSALYIAVNKLIPQLTPDDYEVDEKQKTAAFTEAGSEHVEKLLAEAGLLKSESLYDPDNVSLVHHAQQALRAHVLFKRDTDYIVRAGQVTIIDEFTGRMMEGRRYSEGLHQALEAKEGVDIKPENQTLASVTFQNYFRNYPKLAGMTGTAMTEAEEFASIYGLEVLQIPTNKDIARKDNDDEVYRSIREKYDAIAQQVAEANERGQPVLVGTVSIEKSEQLSEDLKRRGIAHKVLNARYHESEAHIIAQAGRAGAVTIATNMAGRGTDIQLGGNIEFRVADELAEINDPDVHAEKAKALEAEVLAERARVRDAGGLYVIGTERHESRRIDNQLRGRSGRQGDPGASKFFVSLEDDLMRIFGSDKLEGMLVKLGLEEGEAIVHPWINKALEKAQQKVEARNFDIRKNLLKYDDVMNDQRKVVYEQRRDMMTAPEVSDTIADMRHEVIEDTVRAHIPPKAYHEQWDIEGLTTETKRLFGLELPLADWAAEEGIADEEITHRITEAADQKMAKKAADYGADTMRQVEKALLLQVLDQHWKDHLLQLDHLRQGINLRAYAQRDPLNEYKTEAFTMFERLLADVRVTITQLMSHVELRMPDPAAQGAGGAADADYQQMHLYPKRSRPPQPQGAEPEMAVAGGDASVQPRRIARDDAAASPMRRAGVQQVKGTVGRAGAVALDPNDPSTWGKVPRNAPCPCGSGKKYKHCHGQLD